MISEIEKAIMTSELGLNPNNDGKVIRINIPPLSGDRRKQLVAKVKGANRSFLAAIKATRLVHPDLARPRQVHGLDPGLGVITQAGRTTLVAGRTLGVRPAIAARRVDQDRAAPIARQQQPYCRTGPSGTV